MITGWDREQSTRRLLRRAHEGDDTAYGLLYRQLAPVAHRTARSIVRDAHAADDLVQETFYLVLKAVRSGRGPRDSFAGYVLTTVKHLAYRHSKTTAQTVAVGDEAAWEQLRQATDPAAAADDVTAAWASLPPRWRAVLWLIEVERYTPAELADALSMTPNAVSSLATRARRALRDAFARDGAVLMPQRRARRPGRR